MADDASMTYEEHQLAMYLLGPWVRNFPSPGAELINSLS
jgi:hypothetical protein